MHMLVLVISYTYLTRCFPDMIKTSLPLFQDFITICGHTISNLKLAQAKLQVDPSKAVLKLLACLYNPEVVNGNPTGTTNSKDQHRRDTIQKLHTGRMKYLKGIV